jgi:hypothetical protein
VQLHYVFPPYGERPSPSDSTVRRLVGSIPPRGDPRILSRKIPLLPVCTLIFENHSTNRSESIRPGFSFFFSIWNPVIVITIQIRIKWVLSSALDTWCVFGFGRSVSLEYSPSLAPGFTNYAQPNNTSQNNYPQCTKKGILRKRFGFHFMGPSSHLVLHRIAPIRYFASFDSGRLWNEPLYSLRKVTSILVAWR